ncbi:Rha family transcriptional regulator [Chelativorans sp. J32]|uniref:Rha family transcriptional regulator n=1 Tax=Chelativorans sp. J32 TaxID=935840 RepID=UPI0004B69FEA|nr:Rha family transcriptional regulator [Chelativorans sp. J32]
MNALAQIPLTMSSLEIAGLTGKAHRHVLRDIRKMLDALDASETFAQSWAKVSSGGGRPLEIINLPKRESLILVSGYSVQMRARIIDRWQELEAAVAGATTTATELDVDARRVIGGIVKSVVHKELAEIIPSLIRGELASRALLFRAGCTAGTIWKQHGLPRLKGAAVWFGNRLAEMGCQIEHAGRADIGGRPVRLFDPDRAAVCLKNGLLITAKNYALERQGQRKLTLITGRGK